MSEEEQKYFKDLIGFTFDCDDIKYIENIVERKDKVINDLLKRISDLEFEVERLEKVVKVKDEGFKASTEDLCEESTKIEKAIEYIKAVGVRPKEIDSFVLLNILKGDDKD